MKIYHRQKVAANCKDGPRKVSEEDGGVDDADYAFRIKETRVQRQPACGFQEKGLMVDTGATLHITKFKIFDDKVKPETHSVELADGATAWLNTRGEVCLVDSGGRRHTTTLRKTLFIPSYPQDIFSVKAASASGATVIFKQGKDALIHKDGTRLNIHVYNRLYYLHTKGKISDKCSACHDVQTWHEILGHCNYDDVLKMQNVVEGVQIKGKTDRPNQECEVCIQGIFAQTRNRNPERRAEAPLQMVHTDHVATESIDGFKYVQSFMDDYSGAIFVYFLKTKSDTVQAKIPSRYSPIRESEVYQVRQRHRVHMQGFPNVVKEKRD